MTIFKQQKLPKQDKTILINTNNEEVKNMLTFPHGP